MKRTVIIIVALLFVITGFGNIMQANTASAAESYQTILEYPENFCKETTPTVSAPSDKLISSWTIPSYPDFVRSTDTGYSSAALMYNSKKFGGQRKALRSYAFVGKVGGVDFESVAVPDSSLKGKKISVTYDPAKKDGCRLAVSINGTTYREFLPDWVLIPTARYADSENTAVVSLFGPLTSKESFHVVYHQGVVDSLLGMRMLQSDIMLLGSIPGAIPKSGGSAVVGLGEKPMTDMTRSNELANELNKKKNAAKVQSWVFTDLDENVTLSLQSGHLKLSGYPYYHFWKRQEMGEQDFEDQLSELSASDQQILVKYLMAKQIDPETKETPEVIKIAEKIYSNPKVEVLDALITEFKQKRDSVRLLNPLVFDTATQMMRYSAFFRYLRQNSPKTWKTFVASLKGVQPAPRVETPNSMGR